MKKFLFAILACTIALGFTSCREKKAKDKVKDRVENVKESVEDHEVEVYRVEHQLKRNEHGDEVAARDKAEETADKHHYARHQVP